MQSWKIFVPAVMTRRTRWARGWEGALLACVLCVALGLLLLYLEKSGLHPVRGCLTWLLIDEGE